MINAFKFARVFLSDCRGASAAEYALLLSIVAASLAMSAAVLGESISGAMNDTSDLFEQVGCNNNGQGTGLGGGNGGSGGQGTGSGSGNTC
jgi:Flp pilus assembly pilin Flp